jgi:hydroxyacylglutathione hydrolase
VFLLTDESEIGDMAPAVVQKAVRDLALIGLDRLTGWFDAAALAGFEAARSLATVPQLDVRTFEARRAVDRLQLIYVRGASEFEAAHVPGSTSIPVGLLPHSINQLDATEPIVVQCQSGARSAIAASVLLKLGLPDVADLVGGINAWQAARHEVVRDAVPAGV